MGGGPRPARGGQGTGSAVCGGACPVAPPEGRARRAKARRSSGSAIAAEVFMNNAG